MALHFLLHHTRDGYRAYWCRSLNEQTMCQINYEVYGNSSNKYFNHESSNFMLSGNRRRGRQKPKNKKKHSQDSRGCILRMLVAQREHHRQESVPKRCTREALSCESLVYYDKYVSILCSTNVNSLHVNARLKSWASSSKRHSRAQRAGKTRKYSLKTQNSANTRHRSMEMGSLLMINSLDLWSDLPHAANRRVNKLEYVRR